MKWSNAFHNFANAIITMLAGMELFDWTAFMDAGTSLKVVGALALTKIIVNAMRDGVAGMVAEQPPVLQAAPDPMEDIQ